MSDARRVRRKWDGVELVLESEADVDDRLRGEPVFLERWQ